MLSKENINYQITREERSVYIDIFLDNTSSNKYGGDCPKTPERR